jgi:cytochrome c-type biogenesis protein CcmE
MPHLKFVVAGAVILAGISFLMFSGINDSMVYYYRVSEVLEKGPELSEKGIRVSGYVSPGSIQRYPTGAGVEFLVYEKESDETIPVIYEGLIPDTFKDQAEVVVEGKYDLSDETFHATTLLAKCPSKYESQGDQHPVDDEVTEAAVTS